MTAAPDQRHGTFGTLVNHRLTAAIRGRGPSLGASSNAHRQTAAFFRDCTRSAGALSSLTKKTLVALLPLHPAIPVFRTHLSVGMIGGAAELTGRTGKLISGGNDVPLRSLTGAAA